MVFVVGAAQWSEPSSICRVSHSHDARVENKLYPGLQLMMGLVEWFNKKNYIQDYDNVFFDLVTETRSIVLLDSTFLRKKNVYARRIKRKTSMPAAIR